MGGGFYEPESRAVRATTKGYQTKSRNEIFKQSTICKEMNPMDVTMREARDSIDHPNTFPIILGLDETGSMGHIPHRLIQDALPTLMTQLIEAGIPDATLCFVGFGDHTCDAWPLQIGQFESSDEKLDHWLENIYLEGKGGGNDGESYLLPLVFAAFVAKTDAFEKRNQRGLLITVGDEPPLKRISKNALVGLCGEQANDWFEGTHITHAELLDLCSKAWQVVHVHVNHSGRSLSRAWTELMGEQNVVVVRESDIPDVITSHAVQALRSERETAVPVPDATETLAVDVDHSGGSDSESAETPSAAKADVSSEDVGLKV